MRIHLVAHIKCNVLRDPRIDISLGDAYEARNERHDERENDVVDK